MKTTRAKRTLTALLLLLSAWFLPAQPADSLAEARRSALAEARYLKSIYKTDAAIEVLSGWVSQERFDEDVLAELADCHFQNGDYERAAGTLNMLALQSPDNLFYPIRQMQVAMRMKDYLACARFGRTVLSLDSIPAVAALMGDALNLAGQADSALVLYRQALALKPHNEAVVSKAANLLLSATDYAGVKEMTESYLALDPDNPTVASIRGLAFYLSKSFRLRLVNDCFSVRYIIGFFTLSGGHLHTICTGKFRHEVG